MTDFYGHTPPQLDTHCYADPEREYFENKDVMAILESEEFQNVYAMSLFAHCIGLNGERLRRVAIRGSLETFLSRIQKAHRFEIDMEKLTKTALNVSKKSKLLSLFIQEHVIIHFVVYNFTIIEKKYPDEMIRQSKAKLHKFIYEGTIQTLSRMIIELDYNIKISKNLDLCEKLLMSKSYKKMILENVLPEYLGDSGLFYRNPFIFRDDLFKHLNDRRHHA